MKVVIAGGRDFTNYILLKAKLLHYFRDYNLGEIEIVSGCARGADSLGERFAKEHGCKIKRFLPDWELFGKSAGFIRNAEMAKYADACVCFWDGKSKGTKHMINLAEKEGLKLRVVNYESLEV